MTYKETLFFIAQCLSINLDKKNKKIIISKLNSKKTDWEKIVKISTAHYVFPALYINLKKAGFLKYIPEDLSNYMKYISDLNLERNQKIILQINEINTILVAKGITPIFLKGAGNIIEGLYFDKSERMIGDIDILCSNKEYNKTVKLLFKKGYSMVNESKNILKGFKYHHRLKRKDRIAAVEIHKELTIEKYANEFNFNVICNDIQKINNINVLSYEHQICLSMITKQINDDRSFLD